MFAILILCLSISCSMWATPLPKQAAGTHKPNPEKKTRTVQLKNGIDKKMITIRRFTGAHTPEFSISVGESPLERGTSRIVPLTDGKFTVRYRYNFAKGLYKGGKEVTFKVEPKHDNLTLSFSWDDEWRLIIEGATPISAKPLK